MTNEERAVLDAARLFHFTSVNEEHTPHEGDICEVCMAHAHLRDALQDWESTKPNGEDVPAAPFCSVPRREVVQTRLLIRFGSLTLARQRLESDARAYTRNGQMAEAARAWSKFHTVKAELHELEPQLAGIRWEQFR